TSCSIRSLTVGPDLPARAAPRLASRPSATRRCRTMSRSPTPRCSFKEPPAKAPSFDQRWSAWGGAYGGGSPTSGDPVVVGSHDLSATTAGFAGGLDYRLSPNSVVGLALAGGGTGWSLTQGLGSGKSDAFQAGVYGATRSGPAYLAAAF